jgi:hypothetical protein
MARCHTFSGHDGDTLCMSDASANAAVEAAIAHRGTSVAEQPDR